MLMRQRYQSGKLFDGPSVHDVLRHYVNKSVEATEGMSDNEILSRTTDDIVAQFQASYILDVPVLDEDGIWTDSKENHHKYETEDFGQPVSRTHIERLAEFHVPFSGNKDLFSVGPSYRTLHGSDVRVVGREFVVSLRTQNKTSEALFAEFNNILKSVTEDLARLRHEVTPLNGMIDNAVRHRVDDRRKASLASKDVVASLGYPMKRRSDAPSTYSVPEVRRKVTPRSTLDTVVEPFKPEPTLDEEEYQFILGVMENMTTVMERSPQAFASMGEEDIRQHYLVQLNGQYEGNATGETFNKVGKTDILIRVDGENIFVAECKFWRGPKSFVEAVGQLLSYTTWRDTKTALVLFNRNKELSGVLASIAFSMEEHEHKKRGPVAESETRFRYVMGHPSDHNREIIMTVMVFDVPA